MKILSPFFLISCLFLSACAAPVPREISGRLVNSSNRTPIAGIHLNLDRPPGDFEAVSLPLTQAPQPAVIATSLTDGKGRFNFVTSKDKGRALTIRLEGDYPPNFYGYAITSLKDSLHPKSPEVTFDTHWIHNSKGGFQKAP